uniref:Putative secreted protein n=1 Tax=Ixodes ricinus TaxID=34613 RepID=A0A6B0UD96_IXORI
MGRSLGCVPWSVWFPLLSCTSTMMTASPPSISQTARTGGVRYIAARMSVHHHHRRALLGMVREPVNISVRAALARSALTVFPREIAQSGTFPELR